MIDNPEQIELRGYEWALYEMIGREPSKGEFWIAGGIESTQAEAEREAKRYLKEHSNDDTGFRFEVWEVTRKSLGGFSILPEE